jgi:tRNA uridine 5-carboxymethylaminomethyl modification enzyme
MLNTGKGPAVHSPRAQADKICYRKHMLTALEREQQVSIVEAQVDNLLTKGGRVNGVGLTHGRKIASQCVVLTGGTFLCAEMHVGLSRWRGGRTGEPPASRLTQCLRDLGLALGRLKTGTPPRLSAESVDWAAVEPQWGDVPPVPFSFSTQALVVDQVMCHVTETDQATHAIIRGGLDRSPLFTGRIRGVGPRYCPSIEDKVVRFPERDRHRVVLEPETRGGETIYLNGLSTSLPFDVQERMVRSVRGLERARILRPGYAVEYDFVDPRELAPSLEVRRAPRLCRAGPLNGTSGYEEAAAQGIMAGINAVRKLNDEEPLVLGRSQAYVGVLIDDLVTKGADEPYRMFTSRAEHRLMLRHDNADLRLTRVGHEVGLATTEALERVERRRELAAQEISRLRRAVVAPDVANPTLARRGSALLLDPLSAERLLARPEISYEDVRQFCPPESDLPTDLREHVEIEVKYRGYIQRADENARRLARLDEMSLPADLAYEHVRGLSTEAGQKLRRVRPATVGQAGRIPGVTPADMGVLLVHLRSRSAA